MKNILIISLLASLAFSQSLFISEYSEGSSYNKYIEIFNGTGADVDLSFYELWKIGNGGDWIEGSGNNLTLEGTLASESVFVICHTSVDESIVSDCDLLNGSQSMNFNGDDAVGLAFNGTLIDAIGEEGDDPGTAWDVAGITDATKDHTLVRKMSVTDGNTNWASTAGTNGDDSEWVVFDQNTWDFLGVHGELPDIEGCIDDSADNYNSNATIPCDPDCCEYTEYIEMTIQEARDLGVEHHVIVQGIVTSPRFHVDHADYTFQDATAGIVLFGYNLSVLGLNVGDEIKVSGITDEYNGKFEIVISSADDVETISTGNSVTPQVITVSDLFTNGETYESELITILNVSVLDGDWPDEGSYSNLSITDDNGMSIITMRIDDDTEIDGTPEPNWPLDVTGVGGQYDTSDPYNEGYQILPRFTTDFQGIFGIPAANAGADQVVEPEDLVTLDGSASSDENGTIIAYEWQQTSGGTVTLSCTDDCENGISTFSAPTFDDELVFRLTVWDNDGNDDEDYITITVSDPTTIYEIQYTDVQGDGEYDCYPSPLLDEEITTSGIVTAIKPGTYPNFYLTQPGLDSWGGIYVYDTSVDPEPGDEIVLTATVGEYGSGTQLTDVSTFTTVSSGNAITPITVTLEDLGGYECNLSGESYESMLIKVNNVTVDEVNEYGDWVISDGSGQVALVDDYLYDGEGGVLPDPPSGSFSITGIINSYFDYKIEPRTPSDIDEEGDCSAAIGDLNCDDSWNVLDIVALANCVLASNCADVPYGYAGDINGDDTWNVLDIVALANCVLTSECMDL